MMKTYKEVVEKPRLVIRYDEDAESPRSWDGNLGYFITCESGTRSPDKHEALESIVRDTGDEAESQAEHIKLMKKLIKQDLGEKVLAIYPIVKYEHSAVCYRLGTAHGFDYSNNGFYIITDKSSQYHEKKTDKAFREVIKAELNLYNDWINGSIYCFTLYDKDGEIEDSCGGFYSIEDIRECLPKEWQKENLEDYLQR